MPTIVKENYLKALYFLSEQENSINVTELSKKLAVSKPTASNMVRNLQEQGWVVYQRYKPVKLTEKGRKAAALIIRKHRLTEMFLHKIMGFGWEEVHEIAEQMEHIDSDPLFERMDEMLGHPVIDPHGSPIPDLQGNVTKQDLRPINSLQVGQRGRFSALAHSSNELLLYLNQLSLELGSVLQLTKIEPFDESCHLLTEHKDELVVSKKVGSSLLVELI